MSLAYVTIPGSAVKAQSRSLLITKDDQHLGSIEIVHLSGLIVVGRVAITTPALYLLLGYDVPVVIVSRSGRVRGRVVPFRSNSVRARLAQACLLQDEPPKLIVARRIVCSKVDAMRSVLARYARNDSSAFPQAARLALDRAARAASKANSRATLLGIEGSATAAYWNAFSRLNKSELAFHGRSRRPPADPVNALLSFGYALLLSEWTVAIEALGLDPYVSVYHEISDRRPGLALDLMEPFRHAVVDRLVLRLINRRQVTIDHFLQRSGGWWLRRSALRPFITAFEEAMSLPADECLLPRHSRGSKPTVRQAITHRAADFKSWLLRVDSAKKPDMAVHRAA